MDVSLSDSEIRTLRKLFIKDSYDSKLFHRTDIESIFGFLDYLNILIKIGEADIAKLAASNYLLEHNANELISTITKNCNIDGTAVYDAFVNISNIRIDYSRQ